MLPALYQETKAKATQSLKGAEHIVSNADGWTSRATQSCGTLKAPAVNKNREMKRSVVQTRPLATAEVLNSKRTPVNE